MADLLTDIVTSDAATSAATGVESLYRGLLPKGAFEAMEVGLGGAKQSDLDARQAASGLTGEALQFGGSMIRDSAALALAGPAAMFGLGLANTLTDTAKHAVNVDPALTAEHVAGTLLTEMLGAGVGVAAGAIVKPAAELAGRVISSTGRAITEGIGKRVTNKLRGLAESGAELADLHATAATALEDGTLARGRAAALEHVNGLRTDLREKLSTLLQPFDDTAQILPSSTPAADQLIAKAAPVLDRFEVARGKKLAADTLLPSEALELEEYVGQAAKHAQGDDAAGLYALKQRLQPLVDGLLAERGAPPHQIRQLQSELYSHDALAQAIPKDVLPAVGHALASATKADVGFTAATVAADLIGVPHVAVAALGLKAAHGVGKHLWREAAPGLATQAQQTAYNVGSSLSDFDRSLFAQFFAGKVHAELGASVRQVFGGATKATSDLLLEDSALQNLQFLSDNPQLLQQAAQKSVAAAPLPDDQRTQVVDTLTHAVNEIAKELPQTSPLAPPGARAIPTSVQVRIARKVQAFTDHTSVLHNPTPDGLATLQSLRPATHATVLEQISKHAGPNVAPGTHARSLLDALGFDRSLKDAGRAAQQFYVPPDAGRPQQKPQRRSANNSVHVQYNSTDTALDKTEKGE